MEVNIDDIFIINGEEWRVWLVEDEVCHLRNKEEEKEGICCSIDYLIRWVKK
jgi:hypothetical protein